MAIMPQTHNIEEDTHVLFPDNPFVAPKRGVCLINDLAPEILSHIFKIGAVDDDSEYEDKMRGLWKVVRRHLREKDLGNESDEDDDDDDDNDDDNDDNDNDNDDDNDEWSNVADDDEGTDDDDDADDNDEDEDEDDERISGDEVTDDEGDSESTGSSDSSLDDIPPFQNAVSLACRFWRGVALSTPALWTTIVVGPHDKPPYEHVSTLLKRSNGLLIDIYIDCDRYHRSFRRPCDGDLEFLLSLLIPHIHLWRTIDVSVWEYYHMFEFLTAVSAPSISAAPRLETLELYCYAAAEMEVPGVFWEPDMSEALVLFGGSAPCLTSIVLWGVHVDWSQPWIASASKLRNLELGYHATDVRPSWDQFVTILRDTPELEKLTLCMSAPSGSPDDWNIEPVDINDPDFYDKVMDRVDRAPHKLTDLDLSFQSPTHAVGILHNLHLPALRHLMLHFSDYDYTDFLREVAMGKRVIPPPGSPYYEPSILRCLESLKIARLPCHTRYIGEFYAELENLTSLRISLTYLHPLFLDFLSGPIDDSYGITSCCVLPRLVTLYLSGVQGDACYSLCNMVTYRKKVGKPLRELYIDETCGFDENEKKWLKKNVETFEHFEGSEDEDAQSNFDELSDSDDDEW